MKFFELDSPLMRIMNRIADLMILNLLAAVCCIPIITAGASFTALHYMSLKLARNEECYIVRGFFKSFRRNFRQATIIWLIFLLVIAVFAADFYIISQMESFSTAVSALITVVAILVLFTGTFVFPVLAKFDNSVFYTIKNAFVISVLQFPKTILMLILNCLPWILFVFVVHMIPLCILFGFSVPAYASAFLYNKFFKKLEARIVERNGVALPEETEGAEDERIFHDELDEPLSDEKSN